MLKITPKLTSMYKSAPKAKPKETVIISSKPEENYIEERIINGIPRCSFADLLERFILWLGGNSNR